MANKRNIKVKKYEVGDKLAARNKSYGHKFDGYYKVLASYEDPRRYDLEVISTGQILKNEFVMRSWFQVVK